MTAGMTAGMTVGVDLKACEANAVCVGIAPEVFDLGDDDVLHIVQPDPPPELRERVRRAVEACPKRALSVGYPHHQP
jgi:ferredoxin